MSDGLNIPSKGVSNNGVTGNSPGRRTYTRLAFPMICLIFMFEPDHNAHIDKNSAVKTFVGKFYFIGERR